MADHGLNSAETSASWKYATPAVLLHWLLAVLIASMVGVGWYMMSIEDEPGSDWYFNMHKSFGVLVFGLVVLRILWRATHRPVPLPASLPKWQVSLSLLTQWGLYAGMILMPVLGFLGASYSKSGVAFFGILLPSWAVPDHDTAELFFGLHSALAWVLVVLVAVHAVGGLKHLLVDKDGVFQRMWF
ncbi:cytochrome b [Janthinobacterium sp.]|uniref:cytochrome b n=1 Tax=Janthinobacterium sp. TaxID=1871054 RepID=UPI00293D8616|nr:cytochrome b/b6 domain-containing protein [Janthinobacterium sp.]